MNKQERDELRKKFLEEVARLHKDKVVVELKFNEGIEPLFCFNFLGLLDRIDELEEQLSKRVDPVPLEALEVFKENIDLKSILRAKDERIKKLEENCNDLYLGMSRIAYPIWWAQEDAKLSGCEVDGRYAVMLSNDAQHLKLIARSFVKQAPKVRAQE